MNYHQRLVFSVLAASWLVAQLTVGKWSATYGAVFLCACIIFSFGIFLFLKWAARKDQSATSTVNSNQMQSIFDLPINEARRQALSILQNEEKFYCTKVSPSEEERSLVEALPPVFREFFTTYALVRTQYGDAVFDRAKIKPSQILSGFTAVGRNTEHSEMVIENGHEPLFEIGDGEEPENPYPRIYHWVLIEDSEIYGAD